MEVLYRKYRPQRLEEVVGQDKVTNYFRNVLKSGQISHAYLFSGPRGTGKTTVARILAQALNCESKNHPCGECVSCLSVKRGNHLDVLEIDAASNRGIDDVRSLRETVGLLPQMGKFKVYILDEVHMLTTEAFNALLKTLEEPPAHAVFILCTTESWKLPETIQSRVIRFDYQPASVALLQEHLKKIAKLEKIEISSEALSLLAQKAGGSYRDALGLLDKMIGAEGGGNITEEEVREVLGLVNEEIVVGFLKHLSEKDCKGALDVLESERNLDPTDFIKTAIEYLRTRLLKGELEGFTTTEAVCLLKELLNAEREIRYSELPLLPLELAVFSFCEEKIAPPTSSKPNSPLGSAQKTQGDEQNKRSEENLTELWPKFLEAVRPYNHTLEAILKNAQIGSLTDNLLELQFEFPFHKEQISRQPNLSMVEEAFSKVLGHKVRIRPTLLMVGKKSKFIDRLEIEVSSAEAKNQKKEAATIKQGQIKKSENITLLMKAAEVLGGKIIG